MKHMGQTTGTYDGIDCSGQWVDASPGHPAHDTRALAAHTAAGAPIVAVAHAGGAGAIGVRAAAAAAAALPTQLAADAAVTRGAGAERVVAPQVGRADAARGAERRRRAPRQPTFPDCVSQRRGDAHQTILAIRTE